MSIVDHPEAVRRDLRQYDLMLDRLDAFSRGAISLRKLVEDLQSLAKALKLADPDWKEHFLGEWWTLEQVYAAAIDRDQLNSLQPDSEELLAGAVTALRALVLRSVRSSRGAS